MFHRTEDLKKYITDRGFGPVFHVCTNCNSIKLVQKIMGGFQPPRYVCDDCGETNYAPKWENLESDSNESIIKFLIKDGRVLK